MTTGYSASAPPLAADVLEALTSLDGDAIVTFDAGGTITSATATAAALLGGDPVGRSIDDVWAAGPARHVLAGEIVPEAVEESTRGRRTTQGAPLRSADGHVVGGVLRVRLPGPGEHADPEARDQVSRVFHDSAVPTAITDAEGRHLVVNRAFCELFGRSEDDLLGLDIDATSPPEEAEDNRRHLERLRSERTSSVRTKRLLRSDGAILWGEVSVTPIDVPETGAIEMIVQVRDVTQTMLDRQELLEQQRRLDASQEAGRVGSWEIDLRTRRVTWSRHNFRLHLLEPADRAPTMDELRDRVSDEDRARLLAELYSERAGDDEVTLEYDVIAGDGDRRTLHSRGRHTPAPDGGPGVLHGTTVDVTDERARMQELATAEERFRRAFDTSLLGIVVIGADGTAVQVNEAFCRMVGCRREELIGGRSTEITHPDDVHVHHEAEQRLRAGGADYYVVQKRYRHADGHYIWVETSAAPMGEDRREIVVQIRDITESRRQREQLQFLADHDPLTGVLNRRAFDREVVGHLGRALVTPQHHAGALLVLDLDNFKQQNDTFGHAFGDALLVAVAGALKAQVGPGDAVARIGGDEFAVLLTSASGAEAAETAKRVLDAIARAVGDLPGDPDSPVGASLGMAIPHADDELDTLLQRADARMYKMKAAARARRMV